MPNDVEVDDRRSDLAAAFDKVEAASAVETPYEVAPAAQAEAAPETEESAPSVESARTRDEKGRFVPGSAVKGNPAARPTETGAQGGVAPPPPAAVIGLPPPATPPASVFKAPQSWKPETRELAAKLPAEFHPILEEASRRERETSIALQKATETTRQMEPLIKTIQPYAQALQSRGMNVTQVVGNFLRTEQALSNPDPKARAQIIAQALKTYQIPVEALAEAIDAAPHSIDPQAIADQAFERLQAQFRQEEQRKAHAAIDEGIATFSADHEFVQGEGGVEGVMTALLQQGIASTLKDAYERACWADPRIRGILQQREASKQAATKAQATQRAHAASSTVKSSPGGGNGAAPPGDSVRSHLEASWERVHGGE